MQYSNEYAGTDSKGRRALPDVHGSMVFCQSVQILSSLSLLDLQDAMRAAGKSGTEDCPVQMKLVAPPLYVLTTQTLDKNKGIQVLNDAIEVAEQTIKSHKGNFKVKEAPRTVSERDDLLLQSKV